jgi:hypothetical protein
MGFLRYNKVLSKEDTPFLAFLGDMQIVIPLTFRAPLN